MKLFLRSIIFFSLVNFSSHVSAQVIAWTNIGGNNSFDLGTNWTTAVGTGTVPGSGSQVFIFPGFTTTVNLVVPGVAVIPGGPTTITIDTPNNQSVQSLVVSSTFVGTTEVGTLNFNFNSGSTLNVGTGGFSITGGATVNYSGNLQMATSASLTVGSSSPGIGFGEVPGSGTLNVTSGTVNLDGPSNFIIGDTNGVTGTVVQGSTSTSSTVTTGSGLVIGNAGTGAYSLMGNSVLNIGTTGAPQSATYTVTLGAASGSTGTLNISNGSVFNALNPGTAIELGAVVGATGNLNQTNGTINTAATTSVIFGELGTGTYNLSGGTANFAGGFTLGDKAGSLGTVNQSGGTLVSGGGVTIGNLGNGVYNLNGGTLQTGSIGGSNANGRFNFGGGTLQAVGTDVTDLLNGTLSNTSTLDTTNRNIFLNGNLSGSGGFTIIGNNTVALNGANTFTGAINVNGGTLRATVANLSSNAINIGSAGTFFMAPSAPVDNYAGAISGSGTFNTGANTLILNNPINFAGTTVIGNGGAGTLEVGSGSLGNIAEASAGSNFIVGGATPGTVNFTGNNTFTGTTTVNTGFTLMANNLSGSIANAGMLASNLALPAVQTSTFTIGNNFNSTGNFLVRTNGTTTDLYTAGGASTLSGTVTITGAGSVTNQVIVSSTGALNTGGLTAVVTGGNALFTGSIQQVGNTEVLTTVQSTTAPFAITPNQKAVSGAIDPAILNLPASFIPIVTALNNLPASQIPGALDQLSPESLQYSRDIAFENATFLAEHVDGHLASLRNGYTGLDTSGLSMIMPGFDSGLGRSLGSLFAYNAPAPNGVNYYPSDLDETSPNGNRTMSDSANPLTGVRPRSSFSPSPNFSEFVSGDVILADLNRNQSTANSPPTKASYTAGDVTAGISFRMSSSLAAGVLFDYNHTDAKTDSAGSKTKVDSFSPGFFATYFQDGFYVNGLASYGYNEYSNNRNLSFGGLNSTANSSPTGGQYVGNLDFGYDFKPDKHWKLGPTLGATYTHLDVNSFNETGAGPADLSVNSQHADSLRSRLGGQAIYQFHSSGILFVPSFTAAWQHEYLDRSSGITSQLNIPGSNPFTIQTAAPSRDSALFGFGGSATLDNSMTFYLNYLINVGTQDYYAQSVEGGFKARF